MSARPEPKRCDACGEPGTSYHDLPALILCGECAEHFDKERRICSNGWSGPLPKLTPFRLGVLSGAFATYPHVGRKLERLASLDV
jgi:hypothetical protein